MDYIKIGVDVSAGERPTKELVLGALKALRKKQDLYLYLVGNQKDIEQCINKIKIRKKIGYYDFSRIKIVNAPEIITMDEDPLSAVKSKPNASINILMDLLKRKEIDGIFSPGNTGAVTLSAIFKLGRLEGIAKPGLAVVVPTTAQKKQYKILIDVGASVNCKPVDLVNFGKMGLVLAEKMLGIKKATVGLLNVGKEEYKGNEVARESYKLFKEEFKERFYGNVEGDGIYTEDVDVVVMDGFVGNIVLKNTEGVIKAVAKLFKKELKKQWWISIFGLLLSPVLKRFFKNLEPREYGSALLVGVNGIVAIGHGKSDDLATKSGILQVYKLLQQNVLEKIKESV